MGLVDFIKSKFFVRQMILAVLGFGFFFFMLYQSLGWITNHNEKIEVPELSKQSFSAAESILDDIDLVAVVQDSAEYNPDFPKNSVLKQNPKAGDIVKSNRKIYLTLNANGYRLVSIPEYNGKTKRNIESTLKAIGFEISSNYEYVPDIGKDVVRGLKFRGKALSEGEKLPKKSMITLVLGKGGEEETSAQIDMDEVPEF